MSVRNEMPISEEQVVAGLETLQSSAPTGLADRVLDDLGLGDAYVLVDAPIGPLFVAYGPHGISLVTRKGNGQDEVDAGEFEEEFMATFGRPVHRVEKAPDLIAKVIKARVWGDGKSTTVKVPLNLEQLPDFERQVLMKTMEIPRGEVRPYAWVAAELGRPLAVRAVGNALARNPVPFVVPCHRVVRSDGRIGNYGAGGPAAKRAMLQSDPIRPRSSATHRAATPGGSKASTASSSGPLSRLVALATGRARSVGPSMPRSESPSRSAH
jgi:O-6-methylguanine DNA methyltransferase